MTRRMSQLGAAVLGLALALSAVGYAATPKESDAPGEAAAVPCPANLDAWTIGRAHKAGDLVSFKGGVFSCRQPHTPVDGWFPDTVAALWMPVTCDGAARSVRR